MVRVGIVCVFFFALMGCDPIEEPSVASRACESKFQRVEGGVIDPRTLVSPSTGARTVATTADPCVVFDPQAGVWRLFFSFADFVAEEQGAEATGIFGGTWTEEGGFLPFETLAVPQLGTFDTHTVETCEVVRIDDSTSSTGQRFYLYYGGSSAEEPDYTIALSTSVDGEHFEPLPAADSPRGATAELFKIDQVLPNSADVPGNFVTDPTVVERAGTWHMWTLCIRQVPEPNGGICYSTSQDGVHWGHHGLVEGLNRAFPIQPTVFYNPGIDRFEMYVVMDTPAEEEALHEQANLGLRVTGFYHATSIDGRVWEEDATQAFCEDLSLPFEDAGLATAADAALLGDEVFFFYPSFSTNGAGEALPGLLNWPLNLAKRPVTVR